MSVELELDVVAGKGFCFQEGFGLLLGFCLKKDVLLALGWEHVNVCTGWGSIIGKILLTT